MPQLLYPALCPDCGHTLSRSRRRGWFEKLVARILKIRVFRCHRCGARFYSPPAIVVHAPKTEHHPVHDSIEVDESEASTLVIEPQMESSVKEVVVKVAPASETNWPTPGKVASNRS